MTAPDPSSSATTSTDPLGTAAQPPTKVAIVGCGIIGKHHTNVLTRHPAFVVTALIDTDPAAIAAAAQILTDAGAPAAGAFATITEACAGAEVDLVAVTTPSGLHVGHGEEALAAGKHVVIEKPLDVDLAAARRFAGAAREATERGQLVSVISQHRFDPANVAVKAAIDAGDLGTIVSGQAATTWYRSKPYFDQADWRGTWAMDGGAVLNQGVHTVDLMRWLLGRPVSVYAQFGHQGHDFLEVEDTAAATVRFANGALATIFATSAAYPGLTTRVTVGGTHGSTVVENDKLGFFHAGSPDGAATSTTSTRGSANQAADLVDAADLAGAPGSAEGFVNGHIRQYDDIAAALAAGTAPGVTVDEALLSLALVRAIYVSATTGQVVDFDALLAGEYDDVTPHID